MKQQKLSYTADEIVNWKKHSCTSLQSFRCTYLKVNNSTPTYTSQQTPLHIRVKKCVINVATVLLL